MLRVGVGYWPCLRAPFVQVAVGKHLFELWYGLPSYSSGSASSSSSGSSSMS